MEAGFVPNWMVLGMSVFRTISDSSFSALCKENVLLWRHLSDPDSTKCLIFRVVVPRLNPTQLLHLHHWLKCCLSSLHEVGYLDALLEQDSIKQFIKSFQETDPVQQLVPLDDSYWTPFKTGLCDLSRLCKVITFLSSFNEVESIKRCIVDGLGPG